MSEQPEFKQPKVHQKLTSKQFMITVLGMVLTYLATIKGGNVGPLASVVVVAIAGVSGVNAMERKK